jgi:hypothetical protein
MLEPSQSMLERNLLAMSAHSPRAAAILRTILPRADLLWSMTDDGVPVARPANGPQLCSARRPLDEARALAETVPLDQAGGVAVRGFALGYHVRELAMRLGRHGAIFVLETDLGLLRAVLERIDYSPVLAATNCFILTDPDDAVAIASSVRGVEGLLALGVQMLDHPPSVARLGDGAARFAEHFTTVVRSVRTTVVTTLMNCEVTLRNELMNLDRYALAPGIAELQNAAPGKPAVVVAAGPSLRRNLDLLARPGVRDRVVIIAVQTVLKTMLSRGIRPHFVTALDYHEISRRFYEGLTEDDVRGITLIAEAKANPVILAGFPGLIRCPGDETLNAILGTRLAREMGAIAPGSTVAHLACYGARHMGCDPVILIGQDLGFTDGQYYAAGAAIHTLWSGELNPFNTLECLEWQRIVRGRSHLHKSVDVLGRPIYTDEQMETYRLQFERDFADAEARGLTTIDATEGGVAKRHTIAMPLAQALDRYAPEGSAAHGLEAPPMPPRDATRLTRTVERAKEVRASVHRVEQHCRETSELLSEMRAHHADQARVNRLIARVESVRDRVQKEEPAFTLVQLLNQTGTLKRVRADRALALARDLAPLDRQKRQIERDLQNVSWLGDAARQLGSMLDATIRAITGQGPRLTADPAPPIDDDAASAAPRASARKSIALVVLVDPHQGGLGTSRDLREPIFEALNPLQLLVRRVSRCKEVDRLVLLSDDPDATRALLAELPAPRGSRLAPEMVGTPRALWERRSAVAGARLGARACWRGGISNLSIYDEALAARAIADLCDQLALDAAIPINADWCLLDPAIIDATVARHREHAASAGAQRLTFTHAAPGLGVCVLERNLLRELDERAAQAGVFASIGGMLGYIPVLPMPDPIAKTHAYAPDPVVRDAPARFIPDSAFSRDLLTRALAPLADSIDTATGEQIARLVTDHLESARATMPPAPQELILELCTGRLTCGERGNWFMLGPARIPHDAIERPAITLPFAQRILAELAELRPDAIVTLAGAGDPLLHPHAMKIVELAKRSGVASIHLRTDLLVDPGALDELLDSGVDAISVDLMAHSATTYRTLMGADAHARARGNLERLIERRAQRRAAEPHDTLPTPHIVPRLTRCDAVYEEIEAFYDHWILAAGAACIDPLPPQAASPRERIEPLPIPAIAARRLSMERLLVLSDGRVPISEHDLLGERPAGDLTREALGPVWKRVLQRRLQPPVPASAPAREAPREPKPMPPALAGAPH